MRGLNGILGIAAAVAVSLSAGVAQAAFDFTDLTSPRFVYVDSEGLRGGTAVNGVTCRNLFSNPAGLPPAPLATAPPCVPSPIPGATTGCPYHPNNRAADPSCTVYASSAPSADGPFFITAPTAGPGDPGNDYWVTATHVGGTVWNFAATDDTWAEVSHRTLAASGAVIDGTPAALSYDIDFSLGGPGSVTPTVSSGPSGLPEFYRVDGALGATSLAAFGVGFAVDAPWFGQSQNPTIFAADAGIPLGYSCAAGATVTPPVTISAPYGNTSVTPGVLTAVVTSLTDFHTTCTAAIGVIPGGATCVGSVAVNYHGAGGGAPGIRFDVTASTPSSLTLATGPATVPCSAANGACGFTASLGDLFYLEFYGTIGGAPFPKNDGAYPVPTATAGLCPNPTGGVAGLPPEPGYDLAASPVITQHTNFVAAFTTIGPAAATTPVWSPLDNRLDETTDTDLDGIPDPFDNCVTVPNGPLLDIEGVGSGISGCYLSEAAVTVGSGGFIQVDTDGDGYGNPCDGDYGQDGTTDFADIPTLVADSGTGVDSGVGTDMNCDGTVDFADIPFFSANTVVTVPGPSGLYCQGNPPLAVHTPCTF